MIRTFSSPALAAAAEDPPANILPAILKPSLPMLALLLGTSCATPPARPLDPGKLVIDVAGRSSTSPDILLAALALHDAPPLGLTLPDRWNPRQDTTKDVFWHAHAIAFEPTVQASRRRWRAARKDAAARGLPDRANLSFGAVDGDPKPQGEIVSTMDLLGLLGIGLPLLLGVGVRIAGPIGIAMYALMYTVLITPNNNPFMDDHIVGIIIVAGLVLEAAGSPIGQGKLWVQIRLVKRYPILK